MAMTNEVGEDRDGGVVVVDEMKMNEMVVMQWW